MIEEDRFTEGVLASLSVVDIFCDTCYREIVASNGGIRHLIAYAEKYEPYDLLHLKKQYENNKEYYNKK